MTARKRADPPTEQPAANEERGEHELVLGETTYRLRPSFAANVAIEKKTELSLIELAKAGNSGALSLGRLGIIASEWIKAGGEDDLTRHVSADRIAEMIYEQSVSEATAALTLCLLDAITGGRDTEGNVRPATA